MKARIKRIRSTEEGVFGVLFIDGWPICVTLELAWKNNEPQVSCIPAGQYVARRVDSSHFGDTFEVCNVPGRSHILFHGANLIKDLKGCIGLAEFYHRFEGKHGIANPSRGAAFIEFHQLMKDVQEFDLLITEHFEGD